MSKEKEEETVGDRIKQIRGSMGQKEFADFLGIGRTTLFNYENNKRKPDTDFLLKLNLLYHVQPLWLLAGTGPAQAGAGEMLNPREKALLDNYRHIDDEGDKRIVERTAQLAVMADKDKTQSRTKKAG